MTRESIYEILKITTLILFLLTTASSFLFKRNGLVTRKTLKVTYVGGVLTGISILLTAWLSEPSPSESITLSLILCGSGTFVISSILWALKYFSLPYIEKMVEKNIKKKD
jgi:hypothetical protein